MERLTGDREKITGAVIMLTLQQQVYVIIKQYAIKKKETTHSIAGLFLPDSTAQACIHNIIETIQTDSGKPGDGGKTNGKSDNS